MRTLDQIQERNHLNLLSIKKSTIVGAKMAA